MNKYNFDTNYSLGNWAGQSPNYSSMADWNLSDIRALANSPSMGFPAYNPNNPDYMPTMPTQNLSMMPAQTYNAVDTNSPAFINGLRKIGILDSIDPKSGQRIGGVGSLVLGGIQGLANFKLGNEQLKIAKDVLNNNKSQFERNFANQQKTVNTALADRQAARYASNPNAYQPVDQYMINNRV